jgi:hypothetical protein
MRDLTVEINWLETVCQGPFSYLHHGQKFSYWREGVTVCASTYLSLIRFGWVQDVG